MGLLVYGHGPFYFMPTGPVCSCLLCLQALVVYAYGPSPYPAVFICHIECLAHDLLSLLSFNIARHLDASKFVLLLDREHNHRESPRNPGAGREDGVVKSNRASSRKTREKGCEE